MDAVAKISLELKLLATKLATTALGHWSA